MTSRTRLGYGARPPHPALHWNLGEGATLPIVRYASGRASCAPATARRAFAKIARILARVRDSFTGTPVGFVVVLAAVLVFAGSGCGDAHDATAAPAAVVVSPAPKLGVDQHVPLQSWWNVARVTRSGDEVFQARMSPANAAAGDESRYLQMTGLGFPFFGSHDGHTLAGPGVDQRWESEDNEYEVSFRFTGSQLGLSVFSTGGMWKVLVDGVPVGGGAPRSAGSSYAYHVLDLDFSGAGGAESRTITFELSGGAWLSSIGTGSASDRISSPAQPRSRTPSVYWLGDSYVVGAGARYPGFDDLVHVASRQAGLSNVTVDALGGTGYLKSNPAAKFPNYLARARLNLRPGRASPDLIVVGGSINDDIYSTEQVRAAASALYAYLARALPKAKVVVVPFTDDYPVPSPVQHAIDGVLLAARSAPNVIGVLDLPAQVLAQRGNEPVASLSSTLASTTVEYHPSPAAHELYGVIIGRFLARILRQHGG